MSKIIVLLDDERVFSDEREAIVVRTVEEVIEAVARLEAIDELWLDFMLTEGDSMPFLWHLVDRQRQGRPLKIKRVVFHSSAFWAKNLIETVGELAGFPEVELPPGLVTVKFIE